jgi:hypothetical protein
MTRVRLKQTNFAGSSLTIAVSFRDRRRSPSFRLTAEKVLRPEPPLGLGPGHALCGGQRVRAVTDREGPAGGRLPIVHIVRTVRLADYRDETHPPCGRSVDGHRTIIVRTLVVLPPAWAGCCPHPRTVRTIRTVRPGNGPDGDRPRRHRSGRHRGDVPRLSAPRRDRPDGQPPTMVAMSMIAPMSPIAPVRVGRRGRWGTWGTSAGQRRGFRTWPRSAAHRNLRTGAGSRRQCTADRRRRGGGSADGV